MTGFPKAVREQVLNRATQHCEACGQASNAYQWHHRRPRGAGGSKASDTNTSANCLLLCPPCHALIESRREFAIDRGWLVRQGFDPAEVPVIYQCSWAILDADGGVFRPPVGRDRCERCGFHAPTHGHRAGCQVVR